MSSRRPQKTLSWPARALLGGVFGAVVGAVQLFDGLSISNLAAAATAGAVFWSALGVFGFRFAGTRLGFTLFSACAAGLAGAVWGAIRSSNIPIAMAVSALAGAALGYMEYPREMGPGSGAA